MGHGCSQLHILHDDVGGHLNNEPLDLLDGDAIRREQVFDGLASLALVHVAHVLIVIEQVPGISCLLTAGLLHLHDEFFWWQLLERVHIKFDVTGCARSGLSFTDIVVIFTVIVIAGGVLLLDNCCLRLCGVLLLLESCFDLGVFQDLRDVWSLLGVLLHQFAYQCLQLSGVHLWDWLWLV